MSKKRSKPIDWPAIERDYRNGSMSIRELAKWYLLSEAAIRKKAGENGWVRAESAPKAPKKRKEISVTYTVNETVATPETTAPEAIIDRGKNLALRMLDELHAATSKLDSLEAFIEEATEGDESQRRVEALMKAVSLPTRANTLKALAQAVKTLAETAAAAGVGGKKVAKQNAADKVGGKFAVPNGPKLAVDNTR